MRRSLLYAIITLCIFTSQALSQQFPRASGPSPGRGLFGLGVVVGEPTGFSAKYWTRSDRALDFALGASFYSDFRFHGTYLYHIDAFNYQRVPLHYGIGISLTGKGERTVVLGRNTVTRRNELGLGPRGSLGISYILPSAPFDMFIELGATLFVIRPAGLELDLLVGTRFYF
jgi:hypothetical protein